MTDNQNKFEIVEKAGDTPIVETPSLFPNLDLNNTELAGIQQIIKETLDFAKDIPAEEITTQAARGTQQLKFGKGEKGIRVDASRGWGLNTTNVGQEIISNLHNIRSARFLQSVASLYSYTIRRGSFRVNSNITDIMQDTGAHTGKRIYPDSKRGFSDDIILANRTDLLVQTPTYSYQDKRTGKIITKKVGKYEIFENYVRLFKLDGVLWATDRSGNKTYVKKIFGELLPEIKDKGWLRGIAFVKGFFRLDYSNEANRVFLSYYLFGRFSQSQKRTIKNQPLKLDRHFLIIKSDYQRTDEANRAEASNKLAETLDRLKELGIVGDWYSESSKKKKISTNDKEIIIIYPPTTIIKSLLSEKSGIVEESELIKKLKLYKKNNGLTETAGWLGCNTEDIDKFIAGGIELSDEQIEKLANN